MKVARRNSLPLSQVRVCVMLRPVLTWTWSGMADDVLEAALEALSLKDLNEALAEGERRRADEDRRRADEDRRRAVEDRRLDRLRQLRALSENPVPKLPPLEDERDTSSSP